MFTEPGRRVLMPREGRFLGPADRARARVRERRRRVFTVLLEGITLTGLIGLVPPLRSIWVITAMLMVAFAAYVWMLIQLRDQRVDRRERAAAPPVEAVAFVEPDFEVRERPGERRLVVVPDPEAIVRAG